MNTYSIARKFPEQKDCIEYLESLRWPKEKVVCPYCGGTNNVKLKKELRHHCNVNGCKRTFSVTVGTIFEDARLPLPKFFLLAALMLDARKGVSAMQLSRNLEISYKSAWYGAMRIRCAMVETITDLEGIVEADEAYVGGKPRKRNRKISTGADNEAVLNQLSTNPKDIVKRGRGTKKIPVVGFVERDGRVVTKMTERLTSRDLLSMLKRFVNEDRTVMVTDEYKGYNKFDEIVQHLVVKHSAKEYVRDEAHTNTIEGFWSIVKNGLRGQYHVLSKKYLPFYLAEFSYKYNRRNKQKIQFEAFMRDAVSEEKVMEHYKPETEVKEIVYPRKDKQPKADVKEFQKANKEAGKKRRAAVAAKRKAAVKTKKQSTVKPKKKGAKK